VERPIIILKTRMVWKWIFMKKFALLFKAFVWKWIARTEDQRKVGVMFVGPVAWKIRVWKVKIKKWLSVRYSRHFLQKIFILFNILIGRMWDSRTFFARFCHSDLWREIVYRQVCEQHCFLSLWKWVLLSGIYIKIIIQ
jgi:hypothetical protein